jgi:hypothetical protein
MALTPRQFDSTVQDIFKGLLVLNRAQQGQTHFVVFEQAFGKF